MTLPISVQTVQIRQCMIDHRLRARHHRRAVTSARVLKWGVGMAEESFIGGCHCGEVRYCATGAARNICICHCLSCRRSAGAPFVAWATFLLKNFQITHGELRTHNSSSMVTRGHCERCGTSITYFNSGRDTEIDVSLTTLDEPSALTPRCHIWVEDKLPWILINDNLPQHEHWATKDKKAEDHPSG